LVDKKVDRRIARTRKLLRDALLALIIEKRYETITVENITDHADLGRATFYLHYHDKTELLLETIDTIAADLIDEATKAGFIPGLLPKSAEPVSARNQANAITLVFRYAARNADLWRTILRGDGMTVASVRIRKIIGTVAGNYFKEYWQENTHGEKLNLPEGVVANYFAVALMGFMTWWLEDGMQYPPEQMAEVFRRLFFQGAFKAAGLPLGEDENLPQATSIRKGIPSSSN
jgi:AcrR family transcriptional regulator